MFARVDDFIRAEDATEARNYLEGKVLKKTEGVVSRTTNTGVKGRMNLDIKIHTTHTWLLEGT